LLNLPIEGEAVLHFLAELLVRHNQWLKAQFKQPDPRPGGGSRIRR
jgi:hypothetical protein